MSDIIVGSVGVQLVPSVKGFAERVNAKLSNLTATVRLNVDSKAADAEVDEFTKRPREATVKVNVDTKQAQAEIDALGGSASRGGRGLNLLTVAAIGLAPALIPVTAAVGGLVAALSAPVLAAGGGLAGFIAVAGVAVSRTEAVNKQIKQLSKQAETTKNMADAKRYQAQAEALINSLTGPQKALLTAQATVSKAFNGLVKSAGPAIFAPLVTGLNLLAAALPKVTPLLNAVSGALDAVLASITRSVQGGSLDKTIGFFSQLAGPSITGLATILGNIARGFLSMVQASAGLGGSLLSSLERMSASFANIGQSKGFQSFLAYVQQVGPQVARAIGAIADAAVNIAKALAPLGGAALAGITGIAHVLGSMNPTFLGMVASAIGGIVIGLKGMAIVTSLIGGVKALAGAFGLLDVEMDANPVGAIVVGLTALTAAFVYAWTKSETFRKVVTTGIKYVVDFFLDAASLILKGADKAFGWIPGLGPKLDGAIKALDSFKNQTNTILDSITKTVTVTLNIRRIDSKGAGNAALNAEHSGGYKIPNSPATASTTPAAPVTPALSYDPSLFSTPSTTAADNAAQAKKNKKAAKLRDNDSLLTSAKAIKSAGKQLVSALKAGLASGNGGLQKYLDQIKSSIASKLASGDISKAAARSMRQTVNAISRGLKSIEAQYDNALSNTQGTGLNDLIQKKNDLIASVSSGLSGELDLSQGVSQANQFGYGGGTATFASVSSVITGLASRLKTFAGLITSMLSKGFPAALVQEVASLGSANGIAVAQALLSGSQQQISSVSSAFGDITTSANTIGQVIGNAMFDPGIQAQQGLLKGLLDDKGITAAGGELAKKLTKAIRKALKIHSPSRLMRDQVGHPAGQGIGVGTLEAVDAWAPEVAQRMASIAPATTGLSSARGGYATKADLADLAAMFISGMSQAQIKLGVGEREAVKITQLGSSSRLATSLRPA